MYDHEVIYAYDGLGRKQEIEYPTDNPSNPFHVSYEYDNLNCLISVKLNDVELAGYDYDDLNRRNTISYANDTSMAYDYEDKYETSNIDDDLGDNIEGVVNQCVGSALTYAYTYDNVGNILTRTENGQTVYDKYEYDNIYQLWKTWYAFNSPTPLEVMFNLDDMGSRQSVQYGAETETYAFAAGNRLNQYNSVQYNGGTARQILYNANGNMTQLGQKVFTYDARNRMIAAVDSSVSPTMQAQYQYDSMGRRISKTVGASTIRYCYDGAQVIAEYDGSGTLLRRFVYGPGIDEPICMIAYNSEGTETGRYFYHYDGQGNIVGLSNSSGALVEKYNYGVYGIVAILCLNPNNQQWESSPVSCAGNPYFFTGRELDNETGLYYYRARMYEPQLGRFLQPDPIGYADSMNLYQYCGNNPVNFIDPWGLDTLGVHSKAGHSWITYTDDNGVSTRYDLYPGGLRVRKNDWNHNAYKYANRYYDLTEKQEEKWQKWIKKGHPYNWLWIPFLGSIPTNNCASFARDTVREVTGERLAADGTLGVEEPSVLFDSIVDAERNNSTKNLAPQGAPKEDICTLGSKLKK